jgi:hypothetical protein
LLDADRAARAASCRWRADLGAHAKFAAVGELRRALCRTMALSSRARKRSAVAYVLRHDAVGVLRTVLLDMGYGGS